MPGLTSSWCFYTTSWDVITDSRLVRVNLNRVWASHSQIQAPKLANERDMALWQIAAADGRQLQHALFAVDHMPVRAHQFQYYLAVSGILRLKPQLADERQLLGSSRYEVSSDSDRGWADSSEVGSMAEKCKLDVH